MYLSIKKILDRLGYTLVAHQHADSQALIVQIRDLFEALSPDCVLDVGAYVGGYGKMMRNGVGFAGRIISFEPVLEHYRTLERSSSIDSLWEARHLGLAAHAGSLDIQVGGELSSFLELDPSSALAEGGSTLTETVAVTTLEEAIPKDVERAFLKLDVQGYELEVLEGARNVMDRIIAIQMEVSLNQAYLNQPTFNDVTSYARELGFQIAGLYRTHRSGYPFTVFDADAIFTRIA